MSSTQLCPSLQLAGREACHEYVTDGRDGDSLYRTEPVAESYRATPVPSNPKNITHAYNLVAQIAKVCAHA